MSEILLHPPHFHSWSKIDDIEKNSKQLLLLNFPKQLVSIGITETANQKCESAWQLHQRTPW